MAKNSQDDILERCDFGIAFFCDHLWLQNCWKLRSLFMSRDCYVSHFIICCMIWWLWSLLQPVASTINTLAGALYKVFSASPDQARKEMCQACFDYLSLGGIFSTGPIALLSGLNPRPLSLVLHFFAVAIYGVSRLLLPFPSPQRLWIGARLIWVRISYSLCMIVVECGVMQIVFLLFYVPLSYCCSVLMPPICFMSPPTLNCLLKIYAIFIVFSFMSFFPYSIYLQ